MDGLVDVNDQQKSLGSISKEVQSLSNGRSCVLNFSCRRGRCHLSQPWKG